MKSAAPIPTPVHSQRAPGHGGGIGAFFDMDRTVLRASSGQLYLRYLRRIGYLPLGRWLQVVSNVALYAAGIVDFPRLMARLMTYVSGASESEAWRLSDMWFEAMLRQYIAEGARARVAWHQAQGHHVAIVSAATPYAVQPVAHDLGLGNAYLATRLEVRDGRFTGRLVEPACYGRGKVLLAEAYAAEHRLDLSQSYFYTDSYRDLPLLEMAGHPVAVNPDRKLARIAAARGWQVERFY